MKNIRIDMPQDVREIINTLEDAGFEAFAVGGCVRDAVLGRVPADWDITTSAKPEEVNDESIALLAREISKKIESELEYPGQIKVNVVRETRAIDYAK